MKFKIIIMLSSAFILLADNHPCFANEIPLIMSYSGSIMPLATTNVQLVDQETTITLEPKFYKVTSKFNLYNSSSTHNLLVGFPEKTQDTSQENPIFSMLVNGKAAGVKASSWTCRVVDDVLEEVRCERIWSTQVSFSSQAYTTIEVSYHAKYLPSGDISGYAVYYRLSESGRWAKDIKQLKLKLLFDDYHFPIFRWYDYSMPLETWTVVDSSASMKDASVETFGFVFSPVEYERKLNMMQWTLRNFKPSESDCVNIGLQSDLPLEEALKSNTIPSDLNISQGLILGLSKDQEYIKNVKKGIHQDLWIRKEIRTPP